MGFKIQFRGYANANGIMSILLPIHDRTSKFMVNYIAFVFASIGPWINPLAAFTFAFGLIEAPQLFRGKILHSHTTYGICFTD